jgi:hypothetical protein
MQDQDQAVFVNHTEDAARLLNTSGAVDWELATTWHNAIHHYFPRFLEHNVVKGIFAVNVPFNIPIFSFHRRNEFYKIITPAQSKTDARAVVLFRPREWRGTGGHSNIPFSTKEYLSERDMATELNGYPQGTVCYIYLTSDGGANLDSLYNLE